MMKISTEVAKYLPDVEIIEMHRNNKLDAPSGTAIMTANQIAAARKEAGIEPAPARLCSPSAGTLWWLWRIPDDSSRFHRPQVVYAGRYPGCKESRFLSGPDLWSGKFLII